MKRLILPVLVLVAVAPADIFWWLRRLVEGIGL